MGTPLFTVPIIKAINNSSHKLIGIYCQPPKPAGRGQKLQPCPAHITATQLGIEVFTPITFKNHDAIIQLASLKSDIIIVAGYGLLLKKAVLEIPKFGCLNIHPSLLPRWRGAAPIERTIEAGDKETGVCIMKMDEGLDTGDILLKEKIILYGHETSTHLSEQLSAIGSKLILEAINNINNLIPTKQLSHGITYANKILKEEGKITWDNPAIFIERKIRALQTWPTCWLEYKNEKIKIIEAEYSNSNSDYAPGTIIDNKLSIQTNDGILKPKMLQRPGKNIIDIASFLNGFQIPIGTILT
jgi:methionyl-tRNA formyltransferase